MSVKGYPGQEKLDRLSSEFGTIEPVRLEQNGLSVVSHLFTYSVGTDAVEANSTVSVIVATAHAAHKGDVILFTSGTSSGREVKVNAVATNSITLAENLAVAPSAADTFQILRHKYPVIASDGSIPVTGSFTEVATAADGGALPALTKVVAGYDGANVQVIKTDAAGELQIDVLSSALPTGASTLAEQQTQTTSLQLIDDSIATVGAAVLTKGVQVQGSDGTNSRIIKTDAAGELQIDVLTSALPTGAATLTEQQAQTTSLQLIDDVIATTGAAITTKGAAISGTDGTNARIIKTDAAGELQIDVLTSALPTGASTLAEQQTQTTSLQLIDDVVATTGAAITTKGAAAVGTDGTNARILKTDTNGELQIDVLTSGLPTGASTLAEQQTQTTSLQLIDDIVATTGAAITAKGAAAVGTDGTNARILKTDTNGELQVDVLTIPSTSGRSVVTTVRNDYTSVNVTTGAWVQLIASTAATVNLIEIFDSSGQTLELGTGAAASETRLILVFPGGNGPVSVAVAAATRLSIRAVSATANTGEIDINLYG